MFLSSVFGSIGINEDITMGITFVPWVTDIIVIENLVTVNGSFHCDFCSLYSLNRSPGRIRFFVVDERFDCSALFIFDPAAIVSILVLPKTSAHNCSGCLGVIFVMNGNFGSVPNTSSDGAVAFGPIMSMIAFMDIRRIILSESLSCSDSVTSNFFLRG